MRAGLAALLGCALLAGCTVGPDFARPDIGAPGAYRNTAAATAAAPPSIEPWWQVFGDDRLNGLESAALDRSPQLAAAVARVAQARAQYGVAAADRVPQLTSAPVIAAAGKAAGESTSAGTVTLPGTSYDVPFSASYELDLWGRVRRSVESARASLAASEADRRGVLLTLSIDVARYYYSLRELDAELKVVADTAHSRREAVAVNESRYRAGLVTALDVERARVEATTAESDVADLRRQREQAINALAVATGVSPAEFAAPAFARSAALPLPLVIPAGLPSQLLQRRPDLAQAEAVLHARMADIGVAAANRLPVISLTGNAGFESADLRSLLDPASRFWNIGSSLVVPIFDGGRLKSKEDQARGAAAEALADYRQDALTSFREVEDALVALREQAAQSDANARGRVAAAAAAEIARKRYDKGLANYLDVTDAERSLLDNRRAQVQLWGARYASTVALVKAMGGGWARSGPPRSMKRNQQLETEPMRISR